MGKYSTSANHNKNLGKQLLKELDIEFDKVNQVVERVALGAWRVAVDATPSPPSLPMASYQRTGRLAGSWKLNTGRNVGLVPAMGQYPRPTAPNFKFDITQHELVQLWNNVPYAKFVEDGAAPGHTPRPMLKLATEYFESRLASGLNKLR